MSAVTMRAPAVLPPGWRTMSAPGGTYPAATMAAGTVGPLLATVAHETYLDETAPLGVPGAYLRVVFSMHDRHPTWEEMRDALWRLPWGDPDREFFMLCVPRSHHVNLHEHAFHWWQREEAQS